MDSCGRCAAAPSSARARAARQARDDAALELRRAIALHFAMLPHVELDSLAAPSHLHLRHPALLQ